MDGQRMSKHAIVDGNRNQEEEKEDDVSQCFPPVGRHGHRDELARDDVHLVRGKHQDIGGKNHVQNRVVGYEDQDTVRVRRQPDVILTCWK